MKKTFAICTVSLAAAAGLIGCQGGWTSDSIPMAHTATMQSNLVNRPAPAFSLRDQDNQQVSLADLRGSWVVVYFYPKDDTPGCACEATEYTQLLTTFRGLDARVYGVNRDSPASHRSLIEKYGLELDLLSDPTADVMRRYGAWVDATYGDDGQGRIIRSTVIIDPKGIVRHHWPKVIPQGHVERIRETLDQLKAAGS